MLSVTGAAALAFSIGAACANVPIAPGRAVASIPKNCTPICLAADGGRADCKNLPQICLEEIDRGYLRFNWSRVTFTQLASDIACVRVTQSNGASFGYDEARDKPSRQELELVPSAREVRFLASDDPGNDADLSQRLGNALGSYDFRVELFEARCQDLCRESRGTTTIEFRKGQGQPIIGHADDRNESCSLVSARASAREEQVGGAGQDAAAGGSGGTGVATSGGAGGAATTAGASTGGSAGRGDAGGAGGGPGQGGTAGSGRGP